MNAESELVRRPTILHVTTVPMSLAFLRGQVGYMKEQGFDVQALTSPGPELEAFGEREKIRVRAIEMPRRITPGRDIIAVAGILRELSRVRPAIVHAHTPKGGLLGMIAAACAGVPVRIYHMRGLPMMTATGARRRLLIATEWIACHLAHRVLCVSHSVRDVAVAQGLCPPGKIRVLLGGSSNGVDAAGRFSPDGLDERTREMTRQRHGIREPAVVVGFVGRLVRDKGIVELTEAWQRVREECPNAHLLLVGPFEPYDSIPREIEARLREDPRVHLVGQQWDTPPLYAAMDVVVLPTYREGFPNVPLEAAAMRLPVVATRIPGCMDAVVDACTGTLVPPRDTAALADALRAYVEDSALRRRHGASGRSRVLREFQPEALWEALHAEYESLLTDHMGSEAGVCSYRAVRDGVKRLLDVVLSVTALLMLSPVLAVTALLVRVSLGRPVLFRQVRPGWQGRPFALYKFRTMRNVVGSVGSPPPDEQRLTPVGRVLRAWSLDELPELWNVLRGDMSLVGPRPLLMEYLALYTPTQARRHEVRPGITGWAQVHGRNAATWSERFACDVWYVDNRSLRLDLRILLHTVGKVLGREGISHPGQATMERFRGSAG